MKKQLKRPLYPLVTPTPISYLRGLIEGLRKHSANIEKYNKGYELHGAKLDTKIVFSLKEILDEYDSLIATLSIYDDKVESKKDLIKSRAIEKEEFNKKRIEYIRNMINGYLNDQLVAIDSEMRKRWTKTLVAYVRAYEKTSKTMLSTEMREIIPYEYVGFKTIQSRMTKEKTYEK